MKYLLLFVAVCISSCGFALRGNLDVNEDIQPIYLTSFDEFSLAHELLENNLASLSLSKVGKDQSQDALTYISLHEETIQSQTLTLEEDLGINKEFISLIWDVEITNPSKDFNRSYSIKSNTTLEDNGEDIQALDSQKIERIASLRRELSQRVVFILKTIR